MTMIQTCPDQQLLASAVYNQPNALRSILENVSFPTLVAISHTDRISRIRARAQVASRIVEALDPFMNRAMMPRFMSDLRNTGSLVFASVALKVLRPVREDNGRYTLIDIRPRNLNITTPCGTTEIWHAHLACLGYDRVNKLDVDILQQDGILSVTELGNENVCMHHLCVRPLTILSVKGAKIILCESRDKSPIPPLLTSDATHKMVAFSHCGVYCAYPDITCAGVSVGGYWGASESTMERTMELGLQGHRFSNGSTKGEACGSECPSVWRRSFALLGFGLFTWYAGIREYRKEQQRDDLYRTHYIWRLGSSCCNYACPANTCPWFMNIFD
ncbi:uncharacterized protein LACBIDRAFT_335352 [Laccaria bicolor S238N-H82]|uniref:Predicted protein n=1 Tax=Laccaria bicolor (strain S238N-H82 / ATCC MYA-4686) TaxID=486041 RepID=B0E231_LACBS|nr:uncharacterized protein LACBIDRAFT_335352 [Laccaria bicolor S238N-H82]EDQ99125.1 predicted protein [Laccaria bicolor S238N-H82]|eukprot:XP_001890258.1 predicted protein [Laccaria bicolor S238N-H82]